MERRVMFTDLKEIGFDQHSHRVPVKELHADIKVIQELQKKKDEVVNRQQTEQKILESRGNDEEEEDEQTDASKKTKKNKKNKKGRKAKGLKSFMDGDELQEFKTAKEEQ